MNVNELKYSLTHLVYMYMYVVFETINEMEWVNTNGQMEHVTRDSFEQVIVDGEGEYRFAGACVRVHSRECSRIGVCCTLILVMY